MPRSKGRPGRLPKGDLSLSAFEVRLAQSADSGGATGGLGPFGADDGMHGDASSSDDEHYFGGKRGAAARKRQRRSWLVQDDQDVQDDAQSVGHVEQGTRLVDGEEAPVVRPSGLFFRHQTPYSKQLRDGSNQGASFLRLAEVELDFWSANGEVVDFRNEDLSAWRGGNDGVLLELTRSAGEPCNLSVWRKQEADKERLLLFRGSASYWMGASEEQLQALAETSGEQTPVPAHAASPFSLPRSIFWANKPISGSTDVQMPKVRYTICVSAEACHTSPVRALGASLPCSGSELRFDRKNLGIIMEWLFPGIISRSVAQPRRFLSLDRSRYTEQYQAPQGQADPAELFARLTPDPKRRPLSVEQTPAELTAELRPYQRRAVQWMLEREGRFGAIPVSSSMATSVFSNYLSSDGQPFQYCAFNGTFLVQQAPSNNKGKIDTASKGEDPDVSSPLLGGILADEMGLGKTVEVTAMILANKRRPTKDEALEVAVTDPMQQLDLSVERESTFHNESVACVCNCSDELPGGYVQCCACGMWQHSLCVGFFSPNDIDKMAANGSGAMPPPASSKYQAMDDVRGLGVNKTGFNESAISGDQANSSLNPGFEGNVAAVTGAVASTGEIISEAAATQEKHVCLSCRANMVNRANDFSCATLIICPRSICEQWRSEILKHTESGSVQVLIYEGVKATVERCAKAVKILQRAYRKFLRQKGPFSSSALDALKTAVSSYYRCVRHLWPQWLASFDVVLTTYEVLRTDIHHVDTLERQRGDRRFKLRRAKRYRSPPSPLGSTLWRRVCLDEAQEVENSTAAAAEVALALRAKYRWAVTGTPVGKRGLEDLYGLLLFIGVVPFSQHAWWRKALIEPLEYGHRSALKRFELVFRQIMWRNTKRDVKDELRLPGLTEHIHRLGFTPVEQHFYARQHQEVRKAMLEAVAGGTDYQGDGLFGPLLRLRQACCHPQIGSRGIGTHNANAGPGRARGKRKRKGKIRAAEMQITSGGHKPEKGSSVLAPMDMSEVHALLVSNAKVECEEAQRLLFMNMNAVAALLLAMDRSHEAKSQYMEILDLAKKHEDKAKMDSLQRLHTLEGLKTILEQEHESETQARAQDRDELGADSTACNKQLHIERLGSQIARIRQGHLSAYENEVASAFGTFKTKQDQVSAPMPAPLAYPGLSKAQDWWVLAIQAIAGAVDGERRGTALVDRIKIDLGGRSVGGGSSKSSDSIIGHFADLHGLRMVLQRELAKIQSALTEVTKTVAQMAQAPSSGEVAMAADCQLCRSYFDKKGPACLNCRRRPALTRLQKLIFEERSERKRRRDDNLFGGVEEDEEDTFHFRRPCESRSILKVLKTAVKSVPGLGGIGVSTQALVKAADAHFERFEQVEALLKAAWAVWTKRDQQLKACDDLTQHTLRMRMQLPGEEIAAGEEIWKVRREEAHARLQGYELERARARAQLRQALSQLRYLHTIQGNSDGANVLGTATTTTSTSTDEEANNQMCPVCHDPFSEKFAVLLCGHAFCIDCVAKLRKWSSRCPTCRSKFTSKDVRYVTTKEAKSSVDVVGKSSLMGSSPTSQIGASLTRTAQQGGRPPPSIISSSSLPAEPVTPASITVKGAGSLGTKLAAVLHQILKVELEDPSAKCLVFSQWEEVLDILQHGLVVNDISHVRLKGHAKYDQNLALFRNDPSVRALLLPLKSGAKGLNLTEASHVFFAEPICNAAIEAQAIGRIHRMGQLNRTHVHHFVVENTIEAKIYRMFRKKRLDQLGIAHAEGKAKPGNDSTNVENTQHEANSEAKLSSQSRQDAGDCPAGDTEEVYVTDTVKASESEQLSFAEIETLLDLS